MAGWVLAAGLREGSISHRPPLATDSLVRFSPLVQLDTLGAHVCAALMCSYRGQNVAFRRFWFPANRMGETIAEATVLWEDESFCPGRTAGTLLASFHNKQSNLHCSSYSWYYPHPLRSSDQCSLGLDGCCVTFIYSLKADNEYTHTHTHSKNESILINLYVKNDSIAELPACFRSLKTLCILILLTTKYNPSWLLLTWRC